MTKLLNGTALIICLGSMSIPALAVSSPTYPDTSSSTELEKAEFNLQLHAATNFHNGDSQVIAKATRKTALHTGEGSSELQTRIMLRF